MDDQECSYNDVVDYAYVFDVHEYALVVALCVPSECIMSRDEQLP